MKRNGKIERKQLEIAFARYHCHYQLYHTSRVFDSLRIFCQRKESLYRENDTQNEDVKKEELLTNSVGMEWNEIEMD